MVETDREAGKVRRDAGGKHRRNPIGRDGSCPRYLLLQAGFVQRPAAPGETPCIPAVERENGYTLVRRLDEPAVPEVEACVVDVVGARLRTLVAEEQDVRGLEVRRGNSLRARYLAAHH